MDPSLIGLVIRPNFIRPSNLNYKAFVNVALIIGEKATSKNRNEGSNVELIWLKLVPHQLTVLIASMFSL